MIQSSTRKVVLYLALVFAAGAIFGFVANEFYDETIAEARGSDRLSAQEWRQKMTEKLRKELDLTPGQVEEILLIYEEIGERFHRVRDAMEPEFEAIRSERADRIMGVLSPEQQLRYQFILEERERRKQQKSSSDCH